MARKKTKSKGSKIVDSDSEIFGIVLITIGILMLLSIFSTIFSNSNSISGMIGNFINHLLFATLGLGAYLSPFLILFIGFCDIVKKGKINFSKKFYGIMLTIMNTLLFIQMLTLDEYYVKGDFLLGINKIYKSSSVLHGGIISYSIDVPMYTLFGDVGSCIIFIAIYVICLIIILNVSLNDVFMYFKERFITKRDTNKNDSKELYIENNDSQEELAVSSGGKNKFIKDISNKIKIIDFIKSNDIEAEGQVQNEDEAPNINKSDNTRGTKVKHIDNSIKQELEQEIQLNSVQIKPNYKYEYPTLELLNENITSKMNKNDKKELLNNANKLQETLSSFGVEAKVIQVTKGPSVTRFELQPNAGVKVSKIVNLADDIALNLASSGVRIEAPIPGKAAVGIEVPNKELSAVYLREVIESNEFLETNKNLSFSLGKDIGGNCVVSDLTKMPHLLVAGATGSGKSVCINSLIISLLYKYSPEEVKLLLIDPKVVELNIYNGIPHLLIPVVTDPKKSAGALNWAVNEMTRRYKSFAENNVRSIEGYNELVNKGILEEKLPWIVIIIDELADLMTVCANDVEEYIGRLAQMARAAGMHLVIATQRPSVDVITGVIKANIPSRISFAVSSQIDSRTILDSAGAEKLLGKGDMLFYPSGEAKPIRIQGAFVSEEEVERVVNFIKDQKTEVNYEKEIIDEIESSSVKKDDNEGIDELLNEAIRIVVENGQASTSLLQRKLKIGYNRAARIIEQMEERRIISGRNGSKPREILVSNAELKS
ncbi:FtsK/SpoIIIE family DNA translocase [Clostridium estertheticum]|uniref:Cell division protein FtsK n=1 Tax=Clostridium estertheticum subsp. estertheticum TaxID=1552 RepID=A0A1J0GHR3_9CLOT|nr:DNA translocase FtsK [Clostridium estertheticum]APC40905.1 cell division protein FtsK [Clostridium estertheticum subsp. estertheticum]MBZ9617232.1 DNA translocase FtsK [Clostridium estertheticum subsp. laramiense]WAG72922.1 DNA translocase FtsK [Clostridium estertheticum]